MSIMKEFREFAVKGNVVDLAVGLIIGAEFGKIVNSLVNDVIMPPIGLLLGGVDFKNLFIVLKEGANSDYNTLADAQRAGAVTLNIGNFLSSVVSFTVIAFAVFMLVKIMNRVRRSLEAEAAAEAEMASAASASDAHMSPTASAPAGASAKDSAVRKPVEPTPPSHT